MSDLHVRADGLSADLRKKHEQLLAHLRELRSVLVAYSGGVDSAYLAWAAHQALCERALAVTALSPSFSAHDRRQAERFACEVKLSHAFIETHEFENPHYVGNGRDRCYHCKTELFGELARIAAVRGFAAIAYGANVDDASDVRPGHRAAKEYGILAPLVEAALGKEEIRQISRTLGLSSWDRPASACLSSRVPYGTPVTPHLLGRVERAEACLRDMGFRQFRVRSHEELARVEIAALEMPRALEPGVARKISERIKRTGFAYVCLDLDGYRQGSLNIVP